MISKIITRQDTTTNWNRSTVPLACGQFGYDKEKRVLKIGDGSSLWENLPAMGACTDAGVTHGQFRGNDSVSVSFNVGSAKAKKILIFCDTTGTIKMNAGSIFSLSYDTVLQKGSITYQGSDAYYIGARDESRFIVTCTEVPCSDGSKEYVYSLRHSTEGSHMFQNGLNYSWYCITNEVPAGYNPQSGNSVSGTFVGKGETTAKFYCGFDNIKSVYIACTPTTTVEAPPPSIIALYHSETGGGLTYQGQTQSYLGHKDDSYIALSLQDGYLTIGATGSSANFASGVEYTWVAFSDQSYSAPTGTINITENGTDIDITKYAFANVLVQGAGGTADFTQMKTGDYTAPSSDTLLSNAITINVGFRPRVFGFMIQGTGSPQMNNNANLKVVSSFMTADDNGNIIYSGTNFAYKNSSNTNCIAGYSENEKNIFYPSDTGVYAGGSNSVYLKGGATYKWFALG